MNKRTDPTIEEKREAWLRHGLGEIPSWLVHIDEKTEYIIAEQRAGRIRFIDQAELIFDYCAVINRLAQVGKNTAENLAIDTRLVPWLANMTDWPEDVAKAFWYCIRNPTLHTGRTSVFADYGITYEDTGLVLKAGIHADLSYSPSATSEDMPSDGHWGRGLGWMQTDNRPMEDEILIMFDLPGLRKIVEQILERIREQVRGMSGDELKKLSAVNDRLPFFYVPEDPSLDPCQWPFRTAHWRPVEMPAGCHENCPLMANRSAHLGCGGVGHAGSCSF